MPERGKSSNADPKRPALAEHSDRSIVGFLDNSAATGASNSLEYFGTTGAISYATLTADSGDYVFIDRVTYKSALQHAPDAGSTLGLFGLAVAGLAFFRRRLKA